MAIPFWFEGFDGWDIVTNVTPPFTTRGFPPPSNTLSIANDSEFGKVCGKTYGAGSSLLVPIVPLESSFTFGAILIPSSSLSSLVIRDVANIDLTVGIKDTGEGTLSYNPTGTANDIFASFFVPYNRAPFIEVVWSASTLKVFVNNAEVFSRSWAGVTARPYSVSFGGVAWAKNVYYAPTRLGMYSTALLPLGTPSVDTGTVTGAASAPLALASFDGDTSYYTLANGTAQKVLLAVGDLPVTPSAVLGIKTTIQSRKTDTGAVVGTVLLKSGATEYSLGATNDAVGFVGTQITTTNNPATSAAFTAAEINSMEIGVKEGV